MKIHFKKAVVSSGLFVVIISLVACGTNKKEKDNSIKQSVAQDAVAVEQATTPGILFKDESGKTVSLNSLKGKVVFINFWATWCPPCIHEMPSIDGLKKSFEGNDNIEFLMVDVDNKIEQSTAFMNKNGYDLPVYTPAGPIPSDYLGGAIPTTVILDKEGKMVGRIEGGRDYTDPQIIKALNELVNM